MDINEVLLKEEINEEEAIALAEEIERIESARQQLREKLRAYIEEYGQVQTKDKVWNVWENESWRANPKSLAQLADYIQHIGENPWDYLSITPANLRKLELEDQILKKIGFEKRCSRSFRAIKK